MKVSIKKLAMAASLSLTAMSFAHPDSLVLTPPLGWNSWNVFHENINEKQIQEIADAMVSSCASSIAFCIPVTVLPLLVILKRKTISPA